MTLILTINWGIRAHAVAHARCAKVACGAIAVLFACGLEGIVTGNGCFHLVDLPGIVVLGISDWRAVHIEVVVGEH
jgi:hypothetical protein